jgi:hypothetical protein
MYFMQLFQLKKLHKITNCSFNTIKVDTNEGTGIVKSDLFQLTMIKPYSQLREIK